MITRKQPQNRISTEFSVLDIENFPDGEVIEISTFNGTNETRHRTWFDWLHWIRKVARTDKRYRTIYAHNGTGWDWLSLIQYAIRADDSVVFHTIENNGKIIALYLPMDRFTIKLCDSLYLLQCPLERAAQTYCGIGKVQDERLPHELWEQDRTKFNEYLTRDVEVLYLTLKKFGTLIHSKIAPIGTLGLTLPSTSLNCFRTSFLKKDISIPTCVKLKEALRSAYTGGRVEVFKPGYYQNVSVYDFNSLYPSIMQSTPVPDTGRTYYTRKPEFENCGIFKIRFEQHRTDKPPLFVQNGIGVYSGEGWYFTNEIRCFLSHGLGNLTPLEGYVFQSERTLFSGFVECLYGLRMENKGDPIADVCKLLMNSLYGKFAIKEERSSTLYADIDTVNEWIDKGKKVESIDFSENIWKVIEHVEPAYEHVGIAGTITSQARVKLWESMDADTIYCDTDSIHTTKKMETSSKLGELKLEFEGEGVYSGKKLYALRNPVQTKVRAKGVKVGGKFGFGLTFEHLLNTLNGETVQTEFISPSTMKDVLKGKQPCRLDKKLDKKSRKIKRTA